MKGFRLLIVLAISLSLISGVFSADLNNFPEMFIKDGQANVVIVIGKSAKAEDVVGAVGIATTLQSKISTNRIDVAMLDSEVEDITMQNAIVVGGPCANAAAAKLMGYPKNCLEGFEIGKGFIKIYEHKGGKISLLVAGTLALDTRRAAKVLMNYEDYKLEGKEVIVSGISLNDVSVKSVS